MISYFTPQITFKESLIFSLQVVGIKCHIGIDCQEKLLFMKNGGSFCFISFLGFRMAFSIVEQVKVWCLRQEASALSIDMKANICSVKYNPGSSFHVAVCYFIFSLISNKCLHRVCV